MRPTLLVYRLLLPLYVLLALPSWLIKTVRRSGFGSGLLERAGCYRGDLDFEACGAVHVHAVSVGETLLALKLIKAWRLLDPDQAFVLAVGTPTGKAMATEDERLRVVYQPVDFQFMVRRYLRRFEPSQIVLVEGEMWPNLVTLCHRMEIPVRLVNARMSPRSRSRYERFAAWIRPIYSKLDRVVVQTDADRSIWETLGVPEDSITVAGGLKFDAASGALPARRDEFRVMLEACAEGLPVILAASTHVGEEVLIARAIRDAGAFPLIVPRHAERRGEVASALRADGHEVVLRSAFETPTDAASSCLVVDSTGELRDWTAHADVVIIGKSFLGVGGQNPAEAILANKPLVFGPHMENFEPMASELVAVGGASRVEKSCELAAVLRQVIESDPSSFATAATKVLDRHRGAVERTIQVLREGA